ncbi:uncharacterized protein YALI1_F24509g [Yarrowia lipolytica]|uniref:Secreted protein n=1 Tax=Yarrowia lipolytica TaxID=4952 RepID=A0A1D8NP01_YARLL|nr:hypothetical protein YALI1_F24509g [Yarrowia lipolytica]
MINVSWWCWWAPYLALVANSKMEPEGYQTHTNQGLVRHDRSRPFGMQTVECVIQNGNCVPHSWDQTSFRYL